MTAENERLRLRVRRALPLSVATAFALVMVLGCGDDTKRDQVRDTGSDSRSARDTRPGSEFDTGAESGVDTDSGGESGAGAAASGADGGATGESDSQPTAYTHPNGWYSCALPSGWTIDTADVNGAMIDPGLALGTTLEATLMMLQGLRAPADRGMTPGALLQKHAADLGETLQASGVYVTSMPVPRDAPVGDQPGAIAIAEGQSQAGPVKVWFGVCTRDIGYVAVVGLVIASKFREYEPKLESLFRSIRLRPPSRDVAIEAQVAGRRFTSETFERGNAIYVIYEFGAGNRCSVRTMISVGGSGGGNADSGTPGTYEVFADGIVALYWQGGASEFGQFSVADGRIGTLQIGAQTYR